MNSKSIQQPESEKKELPEYQLLLKYMHQLLRYKFRISIIAIIGAGIVFGLSWLVDDRFSAQATVATNLSEAPGGIKPKEYRGVNTLGVIEYDFIIDGAQSNERERHLARMESLGFINSFITEQNLLPWLYAKEWDEENETWLEGFQPDTREAVKKFKSKCLYVEIDKKTDLLNIRITADTPHRAAHLANAFVQAFNIYIRSLDAAQLKSRRAYLERRLTEARNTEMHRSIYRLLEAQLAVESLIFARENYPLEMIQPASEPLFESYPPRKKWSLLTLIGLIFLGFFIVVVVGVVSRIRQDLKDYAEKVNPSPVQAIANTKREEWVDE